VQPYNYAILAVGWGIWMIPFSRVKRQRQPAATIDRRARWGIVIEGVGFWMLWMSRYWTRSPGLARVSLSIGFMALGALLSWSATVALGRHWRVDAGLSADHQLVRSGAYRFVRHPIYASMLCLLIGTGFMVTPLPLLAAAICVFIVGTEIRVRIEDGLLASRFGDEFVRYQRSVGAYIPFVR
jgi:protein-S-isoprenylcysteine O-methyltransferase Ste14